MGRVLPVRRFPYIVCECVLANNNNKKHRMTRLLQLMHENTHFFFWLLLLLLSDTKPLQAIIKPKSRPQTSFCCCCKNTNKMKKLPLLVRTVKGKTRWIRLKIQKFPNVCTTRPLDKLHPSSRYWFARTFSFIRVKTDDNIGVFFRREELYSSP